jgi:hypothetical protein
MQQRRLRLGDIVDDYCPRERRITNHAVVAMIEDEVKQTRCTTCDADHEYKQARVPAQRRKKESLSAIPPDAAGGAPRKRAADDPAEAVDAAEAIDVPDTPVEEPVASAIEAADPESVQLQASEAAGALDVFDPGEVQESPAPVEDEGPVHRRLIRATLPRPEGQAPERKLPEFTIHQREVNGNRAGRAHRRGPRPGQMRAQQGNGQPPRFGGQRQGPRHGSGQGGGQGHQGPPHRRKRRR